MHFSQIDNCSIKQIYLINFICFEIKLAKSKIITIVLQIFYYSWVKTTY